MFTKKEIVWIIVAIIIATFITFFPDFKNKSILLLLVPTIVILVNIISKKYASGFFSIKIEHKILGYQRYGIYQRSHLKKPFPLGLILPILLSTLSFGLIKAFTILQFDFDNVTSKRILKKRGRRSTSRKSEINEFDPAVTAAWGLYSLLALAFIGSIIEFTELTRYSIYYGLWNLIPLGGLDGTKIFFGSLINWTFLTVLYFVSLIIIIL